jgi:hypothetical protein
VELFYKPEDRLICVHVDDGEEKDDDFKPEALEISIRQTISMLGVTILFCPTNPKKHNQLFFVILI